MALVAYLFLGLILPILAGAAVARALLPAATGLRWPEYCAYGWLLGVGLISLVMHLAPFGVQAATWSSAIVAVSVGAIAVLAGSATPLPTAPPARLPFQRLLTVIAIVLAVMVLLVAFVLIAEVLTRPTYPWDAWSSWAYKAKTWYVLGYQPEFLPASDWMKSGAANVYTVQGAHYPTLVPGFQVYLAAWLGSWHEPLVNVPWLVTFAAIAGITAGETWRVSGNRTLTLLAAAAITSLPLINTHVALAGYMDVWLALGLLATTVAIARALESRTMRSYLMVVTLAAVCLGIKVEAVVWLGLIGLVTGVYLAGSRLKHGLSIVRSVGLMLVLIVIALICIVLIRGGISASIPYVGDVGLTINEAFWKSFVALLFSWNWHLFYWLLVPALGYAAIYSRKLSANSLLFLGFVLAGALVLSILFIFGSVRGDVTDVRNYNRLLLQWLPVQVVFLCYLVNDRFATMSRRPVRTQ